MANTFKVVSHDVMPASAGSPEDLYTVPSSTTTVVIGLMLANVHTAQVTASVKLVSDTSGGGRTATNTTKGNCWCKGKRSTEESIFREKEKRKG